MSDPAEISYEQLSVAVRRVRLPIGLVLDQVKLKGADATIQVEPFALSMDEPGDLEAHVAALDLAQFLDAKAPGGLKDFAISIRDGLIYVEAIAKVLFEVRAKAVCSLRIHEGTQLFVDLESVDVMGLGAKSMVQGQLDQINPVLDVNDLPLEVGLTSVAADGDHIVVRGSARPRLGR